VPFELWEIKKFDGGIIALEQQVATSNESIEKIASVSPNSVINKVTDEVKASSESELISSLSAELKTVWASLRERLLELPDTSVHTTQNYLSIKYDGTALIYIRFRKKEISCELLRGNVYPDGVVRGKFFELDDPKELTTIRTWNWKSGVSGSVYIFNLHSLEELDYAMYLIKQKYEYLS
jgi:predicted transport protein